MVQIATGYYVPDHLLSDTEESVVGIEWHQEAIGALADMLRGVADQRGTGWGVCEQVALVGLRHRDGSAYDPRPDVMVLSAPLLSGGLASVRLSDVGAPLFIAEVASNSTKKNDVGDKQEAYAAIGVPEYIVFDPSGDLLPTPLLAWRLEAGRYRPWRPDVADWYHSVTLGVALRGTQPLLSMRDSDGAPIEPSGVVRRLARRLAHDLAAAEQARAKEAQLRADLEEQLRRLREQLG